MASRKHGLDDPAELDGVVAFLSIVEEDHEYSARKRVRESLELPQPIAIDELVKDNITVTEDEVVPEPTLRGPAIPSAVSWNSDIRGGLRTSFALKAQPSLSLTSEGSRTVHDANSLQRGSQVSHGLHDLQGLGPSVHAFTKADADEHFMQDSFTPVPTPTSSQAPLLQPASSYYQESSTQDNCLTSAQTESAKTIVSGAPEPLSYQVTSNATQKMVPESVTCPTNTSAFQDFKHRATVSSLVQKDAPTSEAAHAYSNEVTEATRLDGHEVRESPRWTHVSGNAKHLVVPIFKDLPNPGVSTAVHQKHDNGILRQSNPRQSTWETISATMPRLPGGKFLTKRMLAAFNELSEIEKQKRFTKEQREYYLRFADWRVSQKQKRQKQKSQGSNVPKPPNSTQKYDVPSVPKWYQNSPDGSLMFVELSNQEISALSPHEKIFYQQSYADHQQQPVNPNAGAELLQPAPVTDPQPAFTGTAPFKVLSVAELSGMTRAEKAAYNDSLILSGLKERLPAIQSATQQVDEVLANGASWPLIRTRTISPALLYLVNQGKTFYPRSKNVPKLPKGSGYILSEVLQNSQPVKLFDFSYNSFVLAFMKANESYWRVITRTVVNDLFTRYVAKCYGKVAALAEGLLKSPKAPGAITLEEAKRQIMHPMNDADQETMFTMVGPTSAPPGISSKSSIRSEPTGINDTNSKSANVLIDPNAAKVASGDPSPADQDGEMMDDVRPDVSDQSEAGRHIQLKYFPVRIWDVTFIERCLACFATSHTTSNCSALDCRLCGAAQHSNLLCPRQGRCAKCREHGHTKDACPEKLSRSHTEPIPCDLCGSLAHIETECHMVWRTFSLKPEEINKDAKLHVFCYCCGSEGHFGPECGLYQGKLRLGFCTWSRAWANVHVPNNGGATLSLSTVSNGMNVPLERKNYSIRGRANDPIVLDSSDDEAGIGMGPSASNAFATRNEFAELSGRSIPNLPNFVPLQDSRQNQIQDPRSFDFNNYQMTGPVKHEPDNMALHPFFQPPLPQEPLPKSAGQNNNNNNNSSRGKGKGRRGRGATRGQKGGGTVLGGGGGAAAIRGSKVRKPRVRKDPNRGRGK